MNEKFDKKLARRVHLSEKIWLNCRFKDKEETIIKRPHEVEAEMEDPKAQLDKDILDRVRGSLLGLAVGDALGAPFEFRPHEYVEAKQVTDLQEGGTWGLKKGQFTDDTSMALCLAASLISRCGFVPYDQLVRYKWWFRHGYMSSTGQCFDIGSATKQSLVEFEKKQKDFSNKYNIPIQTIDFLSDNDYLQYFDTECGDSRAAGNGALMRLAPVPLFFYQSPEKAVEFAGISGRITHGDVKAYDACRFYAALIIAAIQGETKEELLSKLFYEKHKSWFGNKNLHPDIKKIAEGSYKNRAGYEDGIRGKGYVVDALEAALWAFSTDNNSFKKGVLDAVNLGDDTDTTAAIYGQLAGAYYGYYALPTEWVEQIYARRFIECLSKWIVYEGNNWFEKQQEQYDIEGPMTADFSTGRRHRSETVSGGPVTYHFGKANPDHYETEDLSKSVTSKNYRRLSTDVDNTQDKRNLSTLVPPNQFPSGGSTRRRSHHHIYDTSSNPKPHM